VRKFRAFGVQVWWLLFRNEGVGYSRKKMRSDPDNKEKLT
jgi:hypothetical protein